MENQKEKKIKSSYLVKFQCSPTMYWGCWTFTHVPPSEQAPRDPGQAWSRCLEGGQGGGEGREASGWCGGRAPGCKQVKLRPTGGYEICGVWDGRTTGPDGRVRQTMSYVWASGAAQKQQNEAPRAAAGTFPGSQAARGLASTGAGGASVGEEHLVLLCRQALGQSLLCKERMLTT